MSQDEREHQSLAEIFDRLAKDFDRLAKGDDCASREKRKPEHLHESVQRTAVQAGHLVLKAVEADVLPDGKDLKGIAGLLRRPMTDCKALLYWRMFVLPWLAGKWPSRFKARPGAFPRVKTNAEGRPLGKDGKPLKGRWVDKAGGLLKDVDVRKPPAGARWELDGKVATEADDKDRADVKHDLEELARDYADGCRLLGRLLHDGAKETPEPDEEEQVAPRRRGPIRIARGDAEKRVKALRDWATVQEKNSGEPKRERITKLDFAERRDMTMQDLKTYQMWYHKHVETNEFPRDPRDLKDETVRKLFPQQ